MSQTNDSDRSVRERRLKIRCWRRGTKEMDLILGGFFERRAVDLSDTALSQFEALLEEDDDALYRWISGQEAAPERHRSILDAVRQQTLEAR